MASQVPRQQISGAAHLFVGNDFNINLFMRVGAEWKAILDETSGTSTANAEAVSVSVTIHHGEASMTLDVDRQSWPIEYKKQTHRVLDPNPSVLWIKEVSCLQEQRGKAHSVQDDREKLEVASGQQACKQISTECQPGSLLITLKRPVVCDHPEEQTQLPEKRFKAQASAALNATPSMEPVIVLPSPTSGLSSKASWFTPDNQIETVGSGRSWIWAVPSKCNVAPVTLRSKTSVLFASTMKGGIKDTILPRHDGSLAGYQAQTTKHELSPSAETLLHRTFSLVESSEAYTRMPEPSSDQVFFVPWKAAADLFSRGLGVMGIPDAMRLKVKHEFAEMLSQYSKESEFESASQYLSMSFAESTSLAQISCESPQTSCQDGAILLVWGRHTCQPDDLLVWTSGIKRAKSNLSFLKLKPRPHNSGMSELEPSLHIYDIGWLDLTEQGLFRGNTIVA